MIVRTESGSRYEIDGGNRRARKLRGTQTEMTTAGWRDYVDLFGPAVGTPMLIVWNAPGVLFGQRATQTSRVVGVEP